MPESISLASPFKPIPIALHLKDEMTRPWAVGEREHGRVMGRGTEKGMRLQVKGKKVRPSIAFTGNIQEEGEGSRIEGRFHMPVGIYWVPLFALLIFAFNTAPFYDGSLSTIWTPNLIPAAAPAIFILGIVIWYVVRALSSARKDRQMILDFLAQTIEARQI